jgi:hypothetical protein
VDAVEGWIVSAGHPLPVEHPETSLSP